MPKIKELIAEAFIPAVKQVGKIQLTHVLAGIRQHNSEEIYQNTLRSLHANFSLLKEATLKSPSRIDDGIVDLVLEAVRESAMQDGVELP